MSEQPVTIDDLKPGQVAGICDHTFLNRPECYRAEGKSAVMLRRHALLQFLEKTVSDKRRLPYAVCVRAEDVAATKTFLHRAGCENIVIGAAVGFPDPAAYSTDFKVAETSLAIAHGATEVDMVLDYDRLKAGDSASVTKDIVAIVDLSHRSKALVKLILETSELDGEQIKQACELASRLNADFVKTSTGFSASGAKADDLRIMRKHFPRGIKISGGVKPGNFRELLTAASGREDGKILLDPLRIRIGESGLLHEM
ncbi:MAG: deoxyribose-phosphate aldolase [Nanoarchaeota archaeon]